MRVGEEKADQHRKTCLNTRSHTSVLWHAKIHTCHVYTDASTEICVQPTHMDLLKCANISMAYTLRDLFIHMCIHLGIQRPPHVTHMWTGVYMHAYSQRHTCVRYLISAPMHTLLPMGTYTDICICMPLRTLAQTNTNQRPVQILCLKKTCDCIKNVGHISQIIKVRIEAVGLPATLSGLPVLGCAQRRFILYI